jgi:hypothetical protein
MSFAKLIVEKHSKIAMTVLPVSMAMGFAYTANYGTNPLEDVKAAAVGTGVARSPSDILPIPPFPLHVSAFKAKLICGAIHAAFSDNFVRSCVLGGESRVLNIRLGTLGAGGSWNGRED